LYFIVVLMRIITKREKDVEYGGYLPFFTIRIIFSLIGLWGVLVSFVYDGLLWSIIIYDLFRLTLI